MANHIVLFEPEIPQNTGNIMRTCAGTNTILHLIKPLGFKLDKSELLRSAVNYIEHVNYYVYDNWDEFWAKNKGEYYFLTRYGFKLPTELKLSDITKDYYFIIGRESTGIPKEILQKHLDNCLRLPINDHIRSLNISNVASIMIFEALRQQDYPGLFKSEPSSLKGRDFLLRD